MSKQQLTPEQVAQWHESWCRANELDKILRARKLREFDWDKQWPIIDELLTLAQQHARPRYPTRLIEYRRRLEEHFS